MFWNKEKTERHHVGRWVIGSGFFSGLWLALGIHPKIDIWSIVSTFFNNINPWIRLLIVALPTIYTVILMLRILHKGGGPGMFSVFLAYVGGAIIISNPIVGFIVTVAAVLIGIMSFK
jgi:hypothetical protein